jgi:hypothetical protein
MVPSVFSPDQVFVAGSALAFLALLVVLSERVRRLERRLRRLMTTLPTTMESARAAGAPVHGKAATAEASDSSLGPEGEIHRVDPKFAS